MNSTLLLGNGFSRSIFKNSVSWEDLFNANNTRILLDNYTFLYEAYYIRDQVSDEVYKKYLIEKLRETIKKDNIRDEIQIDIKTFGKNLESNSINDILTTNYDNGIEFLLEENNYKLISQNKSEDIYSIRRKKTYCNNNHSVNVWKIHGDIDVTASVSFGLDQYCGTVGKIDGYIKGTYNYNNKDYNRIHIREKIKNPHLYDGISWIEKLFNTNVYIAGLGMYYSEFDLWWLINKRARLKKEGVPINNNIMYLYSYYDVNTDTKILEFYKKRQMLEIFDVGVQEVKSDDHFFNSLFDIIAKSKKL